MADKQAQLNDYIADNVDTLRRILRRYVVQLGVSSVDNAEASATDLLHDVVVEALKFSERLPDDAEPLPWLMGIAVNLIKRRRADFARRSQREPLLRDLFPADLSEDDIYDQFVAAASSDSHDPFHHHQQIEALLVQISSEDAQFLRLAIQCEMNGDKIAAQLGISPGAARVRLHRVIKRTRVLVNAKDRV